MQQSAPLRLGGSGNLTELKLALPSDATFLPDRIVRPSSTPKNAPPTYASYASNWSTVVCAPTTSVASKPPNEKQKMDAMDEELIASAAEPQETRKPKRIQPIHTGPIPSVSTPTVFSTAPFWTKSADLKPNRTRPVQRTVELVCLFQAYKIWKYLPGLEPEAESIIVNFVDNLVLTHCTTLNFYPTVAADSTHIFGLEPDSFERVRIELEGLLDGVVLPSQAAVKVTVQTVRSEAAFPLQPRKFAGTADEIKQEYLSMMQSFFLHNKQLAQEQRRHDVLLHSLRHLFYAHISLRKRTKRYLSLDIEAWEQDHDKIIEVGWAVAQWQPDGQEWHTTGVHLIVQEFMHLRNGLRVADHRDHYNFGQSQILPLKKCMQRLKQTLKQCDVLVGHAAASDEKFLRSYGISFSGKPVLDTQVIAKSVMTTTDHVRLSRILDHLNIEHVHLHNAGNDAYYTMDAFLKMCLPLPKTVARMIGVDWVGFVEQSKIRSNDSFPPPST